MNTFILFSTAHIYALLCAITVLLAIVIFHKTLRHQKYNTKLRMFLVWVLIGSEVALYSWYTIDGLWGWFALPFQLCTMTLWLSIIMLVTRNYKIYEITLFLGTIGALQALITPVLSETFPHFRYFHFFAAHIGIIAANGYMTIVEGYRPTIRSVVRAWIWLQLLAITAFMANKLSGENFMFLDRKPTNETLLDLLAPWPWYILQLEIIAIALLMALYGFIKVCDRFCPKYYSFVLKKSSASGAKLW